MTLYDLIYIIGCGVAFIMATVGFSNAAQAKKEFKDKLFLIFMCSLVVSLLSWAVPIWWLGFNCFFEKKSR